MRPPFKLRFVYATGGRTGPRPHQKKYMWIEETPERRLGIKEAASMATFTAFNLGKEVNLDYKPPFYHQSNSFHGQKIEFEVTLFLILANYHIEKCTMALVDYAL